MAESPFDRAMARVSALRRERGTWEPHYRELAKHMLPRRARWGGRSDLNRGDRLNDAIINNKPLLAARILASGLMAGITSPSRIWFRLTTADPDLADYGPVRKYLHLSEERLRWAFARSTYYSALADGIYPDISVFGTACGLMEEDAKVGLRVFTCPVGEYALAANARGEIDTIGRDRVPMTVRQLVHRFGTKTISTAAKNAWDRGNYETHIEVAHIIEPNDELDPGKAGPDGMAWSSKWMELGSDNRTFLGRGGYEEFPGLTPRWYTRDGDAYGRSPGMDALGDCKELQFLQRRLANLIDKSADPPMKASQALQMGRPTLLPGDTTYLPNGQGQVFEPSMVVNPSSIANLREHIAACEDRINAAFYADLWMYLLNDDRRQRGTATEVTEAKQETMLQLGPVLENLNGGLFDPSISRAFALLDRRGWLPPPPKELAGQELKTEFISVMHQIQKMTGLVGVRTLVQEIGVLASLGRSDALDKLNVDQIADEIASMVGTKPEMLLSSDEVAQVRQARATRQAAADNGAAMLAAAKGAKDASQIDPVGLQAVAGTVAPVAAAQGFPQPGASA